MTRVFIPEELTLTHLVFFPTEAPSVCYKLHDNLRECNHAGDVQSAQDIAQTLYTVTEGVNDSYLAALAQLYIADLSRHRHSYALSLLKQALARLYNDGRAVARYHEALSHYLEGIIYCAKNDKARLSAAFKHAQQLLTNTANLWHHYGAPPLIPTIIDLNTWMNDLFTLSITTPNARSVNIVPCYDLSTDGILSFRGATYLQNNDIESPSSSLPSIKENYFVMELRLRPNQPADLPRQRFLIKRIWDEEPVETIPPPYGPFVRGENHCFTRITGQVEILGRVVGPIIPMTK